MTPRHMQSGGVLSRSVEVCRGLSRSVEVCRVAVELSCRVTVELLSSFLSSCRGQGSSASILSGPHFHVERVSVSICTEEDRLFENPRRKRNLELFRCVCVPYSSRVCCAAANSWDPSQIIIGGGIVTPRIHSQLTYPAARARFKPPLRRAGGSLMSRGLSRCLT